MAWTVSRRIAIGFAVVLSLVLILAVVSIMALREATEAYEAAAYQEREVLDRALVADKAASEATIEFQRYLLSRDEQYANARDTSIAAVRRLLGELGQFARFAENRGIWSQNLVLLDRWDEGSAAAIAAARAGDTEGAVAMWETRILPARLELESGIRQGVEGTRVQASASHARAQAAADRNQVLLGILALIALGIGIISGVLLNRAVSGPLRETTGVLAANGAQILAATAQQASGVSETSAAIAQTATTVDEVAQTAEQAADRARAVAESAQHAMAVGKTGRQTVEESVAAMEQVKEQVESIAESIVMLADHAQAIGEIIATVNEIAEQTNLLALNAAVEAARAGEHGRGFAVVAGEVRRLADQSKGATVQVRQILGDIQRAMSAAVMTTERGTQQVTAGARQVSKAGETIRELADQVAAAAQAAAQIVASAGQQAAGMAQIRQAMGNIQDATHQNLASTRQTEQAAKELNRLGTQLLHLVGGQERRLIWGLKTA